MGQHWLGRIWRRAIEGPRADAARSEAGLRPETIEDWEARLVEEGVGSEWAAPLASRLAALHRELGDAAVHPMLRATLETVEVQAAAHAHVERNMRDVREVERLLGAFSGELEKLDEVLEVLAAYAQRMRTQPARKDRHTLH